MTLVTRFAGTCGSCGAWVPVGSTAEWDRDTRTIRHATPADCAAALRDFVGQALRPFFKKYGPLELGRILVEEHPKLAGKVAGEEYERRLRDIARRRGQSLAQMAYAWVLRDPRVTTTLIGASSPEQIRENVGALANLDFSADELAEIDRYAVESGVNLWEKPSTDQRV